jgi:hypothetical protein
MHGQSAIASEANGKTVAIAYDGKADAHLIAAAPDLLAALETIAAGNTDPDGMVRIAAEALSKAEGEQ